MFGATLALKGAIEEQRTGHCEPGCAYCAMEAGGVFYTWLKEQRPFFNYRVAALDDARRLSDLTPRIP